MPLYTVKRHGSRSWYIRGIIRGQRLDKSTKTDNWDAAEAIRIKEETRLLNRSIFGERATVTFVEATVSFMENGGEARFIKPLLDYFKTRRLDSIGQADIDTAAKAIYPKAKPSTRDRQVYSPMSAILRHGAKRHWCDFIILERPTYNNARVNWITIAQAERLVDVAAPHLKPLLTFLFGTGARLSEALNLRWTEINLSKAHVTFLDTKNGEDRGVALSARVVAVLASLPHRVGAVFLTDDGKPYRAKKDSGGQIKTAFATAVGRAKIGHFTPHDCRHTWASWHYQANRDFAALKALGGWKSDAMVLRYAHVNVENLADGIRAMGW